MGHSFHAAVIRRCRPRANMKPNRKWGETPHIELQQGVSTRYEPPMRASIGRWDSCRLYREHITPDKGGRSKDETRSNRGLVIGNCANNTHFGEQQDRLVFQPPSRCNPTNRLPGLRARRMERYIKPCPGVGSQVIESACRTHRRCASSCETTKAQP